MAAPLVRHKVTEVSGAAKGVALGTTAVTILTGGTGLKDPSGQASGYGGNLDRVIINVSGSTARRVKLYLVPSGGSVGEDTKVFDQTLQSGVYYPVFSPPLKYKDSATLQGTQDAGTDVYVHADAREFY